VLKKVASYVIVLAIGVGVGTYFDAKHTIEEKTVYKDRVKTVVKEVITERPDGTKITERHTDKEEKTKQVNNKSESRPVKKDWGVGVKYDLLQPGQTYTLEIHRRIIGDFYVSGYGRTDGTAGLGLTFFF
jgi:hypothetical protein